MIRLPKLGLYKVNKQITLQDSKHDDKPLEKVAD